MEVKMLSHGLENLLNDQYIGLVIDNNDVTNSGRCKVRVFHLMDTIPDEFIPWASPKLNSTFGSRGGGSLSVPKVNTVVGITFNCGDLYSPEYYGISNVDVGTVYGLSEDYEDSQILANDSDNQFSVYFQKAKGFLVNLKNSVFGIKPDNSLEMSHNNGSSSIELKDSNVNITSNNDINIGGETNAAVNINSEFVKIQGNNGVQLSGSKKNEYAVNGLAIMDALIVLAKAIDMKTPQSSGVTEAAIRAMKYNILNNKVKYN